jgi:hypothetical protein
MSLAPVVFPGALTDIGAGSSAIPFVIFAGGQSNMTSQDYTGSTFIDTGIYVTNSWGNATVPTAIVPAAYGTAPLNQTLAGATTTDPTLAYKSQAISCANQARAYLRANGQANRPILIVGFNAPAQSISDWVDRTPLDMWAVLLAGIALVNAAYGTSWTVNAVLWCQGENDNTGTYGTDALYAAAHDRLIGMMTALPCWSADSRWLNVELAQWNAATQSSRNTFFRTTADGARWPFMSFVSSSGMTASALNPPVHYDGISQIKLGVRAFQEWRRGQMRGGYGGALTYFGSKYAYPGAITIATGTAGVLNVDDVLTGAVIIVNGGSLLLPNPAYCFATVLINCTAQASLLSTGNVIIPENNGGVAVASTTLISTTLYECVPIAGQWFVFSVAKRVGGMIDHYPNSQIAAASTLTLNSRQMQYCWYSVLGGPISLTPGIGCRSTFYNDAAATSASVITVASGVIIGPDGKQSTTYPVTPNSTVEIAFNVASGTASQGFVTYDSAISSAGSMKAVPVTGGTVTCTTGVGRLVVAVEPAAALAALTIALPSFPKGGNEVIVYLTQAITALTFTNGTVGTFTGGSATTAKQKIALTYSAEDGVWY